METIILFDPGIRSWNKGDEVIMRSAKAALEDADLLRGRFVVHSATHAPIVTFYQNNRHNPHMKIYDQARYKILCGSNLLWKNMAKPLPSLNVNLWNCRPYRGSVLMGAGMGQAEDKTNLYTKKLYSKILSKDYIHSTRDGRTAEFLKSLGYRALDTGCPSMWKLTPEFCGEIPAEKAEDVVFTLTDYNQNRECDQKLVDILKEHYSRVFFWPQGLRDKEYLDTLKRTDQIRVLDPDLEIYESLLSQGKIDYVGTRLHGGMFAMQHKIRTILIAIDNRTRDMKEEYELHVIEREEIDRLPEFIYSNLKTDVQLKQDNINKWLSQFQKISG